HKQSNMHSRESRSVKRAAVPRSYSRCAMRCPPRCVASVAIPVGGAADVLQASGVMIPRELDRYRCEECGFVSELPSSNPTAQLTDNAMLCCARCGAAITLPHWRLTMSTVVLDLAPLPALTASV